MTLVCTVSTVKDTLPNVDLFVRRNLAAGADHMFVFLDDADPEMSAHFADHPHVTAIRCGAGYWGGRRPHLLNRRQTVNANLVNVLLSPFRSVRWLFHIDGDECLDIDRSRLLDLPEDARAVHLPTLEAVAQQHWSGPVDRFKRPLDEDELILLSALGVIRRPTMEAYFNGHVGGKMGVRPDVEVKVATHRIQDLDQNRLQAQEHHVGHVLHYESFSGDEFVRKWVAHLSNVERSPVKRHREMLRRAFGTIAGNSALSEQTKESLLRRLYARHVEDDLDTLEELGLLVTPDPDRHGHVPRAFDAPEMSQLAVLLQRLRAIPDKDGFRIRGGARHPRQLLQEARAGLGLRERALVKRLDAALRS